MKDFEELTYHGDVTDWIPDDVYSDLILDGVVCYGQLSGVVTAMEYDFTAGGGNTIQVRYVSPRTNSCTSQSGGGACNCLSEVSTTFGTYPIPVKSWGDYDKLCGFSIWEAKGNIKAMVLNEMAKRMANCRDKEIWSNLVDDIGSPNIDIESEASCNVGTVTSCCTYSYNLYNSIVSAQKHLQGDAYSPDYVIMHPEVAQYLYMKDGGGYHESHLPTVKFDNQGQLDTIAGLKVIECCNANKCLNKGGHVTAVVIDSSRAVGEVWGKKPKFEEKREPYCDTYDEVVWMYWGSAQLDTNAVAWISNP